MYVCAQLWYLRLENHSAVATSKKKSVIQRRENRILPLICSSANASTEVVPRHTSRSPLHFDI